MKFRVGGHALCNHDYNHQFTKNKIYQISRLNQSALFVTEDDLGSTTNGWGYLNFTPVDSKTVSKLEKIIYNLK